MSFAPVGTAIGEVHTAVYGTLAGDSALMAQVTGVFDEVEESQGFPFVSLGEATELIKDVFDQRSRELTISLHVWSQAQGYAEAITIVDRLDTLLDRQSLTTGLVRFHHVYTLYDNCQLFRDSDGLSRHAVLRYRILVEQN